MADLSLLLDDATAEAKRRGHGVVTPAHLAVAISVRHADALPETWAAVLAAADRELAALPVTYDAPVVQATTEAIAPALKAGDLTVVADAVTAAVLAEDVPAETSARSTTLAIPETHAPYTAIVAPRANVLGRSDVLDQMLDALERKDAAPVLLVGDEGSGRTAMAAALASALPHPVVRIDNAAAPSDKQLAALTEMLRLPSGTDSRSPERASSRVKPPPRAGASFAAKYSTCTRAGGSAAVAASKAASMGSGPQQ